MLPASRLAGVRQEPHRAELRTGTCTGTYKVSGRQALVHREFALYDSHLSLTLWTCVCKQCCAAPRQSTRLHRHTVHKPWLLMQAEFVMHNTDYTETVVYPELAERMRGFPNVETVSVEEFRHWAALVWPRSPHLTAQLCTLQDLYLR